MSVKVEGISIIIRKDAINRVYPGGWDAFAKKHEDSLGSVILHDEHLMISSSVFGQQCEQRVNYFKAYGLVDFSIIDGKTVWQDACLANCVSGIKGECDWLEYDNKTKIAYLKGYPRGELALYDPDKQENAFNRNGQEAAL